MRRMLLATILVQGGWSLLGSTSALGQEEPTYPDAFSEPMPLYLVGLGPLERTITTGSSDAQAFFDQGLQFMYAFTPVDAARSFREAQRYDPSCAMCYWGEAWAWGPYLNGPMGEDDAPRAYAAIHRAVELSSSATPVERALIEAMAVRYTPTHDTGARRSLDQAYADAMARVWEQFPRDMEVGTLYGESLMLLEPRRGTWDATSPGVRRIHSVLESTLALDISHPGACHLYIHSTESTTRAGEAQECADLLGSAIPGASHINHMPSHTYNEVGRWADGVRANIQAWHSDQKAAIGEGFAIYPSHNLHMLLFAASMDGQGAIAIQAGKDYAKIVEGGVFYHVLALLRFGRFDEILALSAAPENAVFRGFWAFGRGYAHLRMEAPDSARAYLDEVRRLSREDAQFRGHTAEDLLGVVGGILEGEILIAEGRTEEAIDALQDAVRFEDGLRYDEPEPLNFSARDWLGAALLESGRYAEAEAEYRAALEDHPRNGWALYGLRSAVANQGRDAEAAAIGIELEEAWARSDTWLRSSRF